MSRPFQYCLNGLRIASELEINGLAEARFSSGIPDVQIVVSGCADPPSEYYFGCSDDAFQIDIPRVGRYVIRGGREIQIWQPAGVEGREGSLWLLGSTMGALLYQRGALPLHASAVVVGGECIAFAGPCGAGKSTLCAFLAQRGYAVVSDDVLAISLDASGGLQVGPGSPSLRLKGDALRALDAETDAPCKRREADEKYLLHRDGTLVSSLPLRSVYVLHDLSERAFRVYEVGPGLEAFDVILHNVYRPEFASALGCFDRTFALAAAVANQVPVYRLSRFKDFLGMPHLLELLEARWRG